MLLEIKLKDSKKKPKDLEKSYLVLDSSGFFQSAEISEEGIFKSNITGKELKDIHGWAEVKELRYKSNNPDIKKYVNLIEDILDRCYQIKQETKKELMITLSDKAYEYLLRGLNLLNPGRTHKKLLGMHYKVVPGQKEKFKIKLK